MAQNMGEFDIETMLAQTAKGPAAPADGMLSLSDHARRLKVREVTQWPDQQTQGGTVPTRAKTPIMSSSNPRTPGALMTVAETAEHLRCSQKTVWRLLQAGRLRGGRITGSSMVRIRRDEVERCLAPLVPVEQDVDQFIAGQA